jgi:hypothetical protein
MLLRAPYFQEFPANYDPSIRRECEGVLVEVILGQKRIMAESKESKLGLQDETPFDLVLYC